MNDVQNKKSAKCSVFFYLFCVLGVLVVDGVVLGVFCVRFVVFVGFGFFIVEIVLFGVWFGNLDYFYIENSTEIFFDFFAFFVMITFQ